MGRTQTALAVRRDRLPGMIGDYRTRTLWQVQVQVQVQVLSQSSSAGVGTGRAWPA